MRGSKKQPHVNLYVLVLLWTALELQLYVGGLPVPVPMAGLVSATGHASLDGTKVLVNPPISATEAFKDTRELLLKFDPTRHAHIQENDVHRINSMKSTLVKDDELTKKYKGLVRSSHELNSEINIAWEGIHSSSEAGNVEKGKLSTLEKMQQIYHLGRNDKSYASIVEKLEKVEDIYNQAIKEAWSRFMQIINPVSPIYSEYIVAAISSSSEDLRSLYFELQNSKNKVSQEVLQARKLLKEQYNVGEEQIKEAEKEIEKELKLKEDSVITEISPLDLEVRAVQKVLKSQKSKEQKTINLALGNLENAFTNYENKFQESLKKTQISLEKMLGLTNESGDIPSWSLNPARLTPPGKSDTETKGSTTALENFNTAYTELEKKVDMAYNSAKDASFEKSELKKKMNFVEYLFDLKSRANPASFPQNAKEGWTRRVRIQVAGNMKGEELKGAVGVSSDWERLTTSYGSAAHEAEVALQRDSFDAFVRSSLTPTEHKLLEGVPFFRSETPREGMDGNSLLAKMHYTYEEAFEETLKEAKANNVNVEKILKDKISRIKAESKGSKHSLDEKDLETAAKREFIMDQAYRTQSENPIAFQEFEKVRSSEQVAQQTKEEMFTLAEEFNKHNWNTIKPMSAEEADLLENADLSGRRGEPLRREKGELKKLEEEFNSEIETVYEQAVKVATGKGETEEKFARQLTSELEKLKEQFTGKTLTLFDEEVASRDLKLKIAKGIAKKYDDDSLNTKLKTLDQSQRDTLESRKKALALAKLLPRKTKIKKQGFLSATLSSIWSRIWSRILKLFGIEPKIKIVPFTPSEAEVSKAIPDVPPTQEFEKQAAQKTQPKSNSRS